MRHYSRLLPFVVCIAAPLIGQLAWAGDAPPPASSNHQALWSTPGDGQLVMLMRSGAFYDAKKPALPAVPLRVRVCVTNMTGSNNSVNLYVWTTEGPLPNLNNNPDRAPPVNQPAASAVDEKRAARHVDDAVGDRARQHRVGVDALRE